MVWVMREGLGKIGGGGVGKHLYDIPLHPLGPLPEFSYLHISDVQIWEPKGKDSRILRGKGASMMAKRIGGQVDV